MLARSPKATVWLFCPVLAVLAVWLRPKLGDDPTIPGASILALIIGALVVHLPGARGFLAGPSKSVVKQGIPYAIVLIGFGLNLSELWRVDVLGYGLVTVIAGMLTAFFVARLIGAWMGLDPRTSILLGAGTAVCGNSAIMAVAPVVRPDEEDLALSLGVINLLGLLMVFVLPPVVTALGMGGAQGGMLAGMTVHAVPQAVAAGEVFGKDALALATLYKLVRVGLLVPTVLLIAVFWSRSAGADAGTSKKARVPVFLWLFVAAAAIRTLGLVDGTVSLPGLGEGSLWSHLRQLGKFGLTVVMAAVGMGIYLPSLVRVGPRVLAVAIAAVAAMTLVCSLLVKAWF